MPNEILNLDEILEEEDETMVELRAIRNMMDKEYEADPEKFKAELRKWTPGFTYGIPGRVFKTKVERDAYIESKRIPCS